MADQLKSATEEIVEVNVTQATMQLMKCELALTKVATSLLREKDDKTFVVNPAHTKGFVAKLDTLADMIKSVRSLVAPKNAGQPAK